MSRDGTGTLDVTAGRWKAKRFSNRPAVAAGALNWIVVGGRFDILGSEKEAGFRVVVVVVVEAVEKVVLGVVVVVCTGRKAAPVLGEN